MDHVNAVKQIRQDIYGFYLRELVNGGVSFYVCHVLIQWMLKVAILVMGKYCVSQLIDRVTRAKRSKELAPVCRWTSPMNM